MQEGTQRSGIQPGRIMKATREHGSIAENVKVHFAGSENVEFAYVLHDAGGELFSFYCTAVYHGSV